MILTLTNFRNFSAKNFNLSAKHILLTGPNASGKTNILEALFLLGSGKSFHAQKEVEMIKFASDFARVQVKINKDLTLEVILPRNGYKKLKVNNLGKRLIDYVGNLRVVLFRPQDIELLTGSPSVRRNFLDSILSSVNRDYRKTLISYEKGLRQRNRLLKRIRDENLKTDQLLFWNQLLIKNGDYLSQKREDLITFINETSQLNNKFLEVKYLKNAISEGRLTKYAQEEIFAAQTLVGPHRDDFEVFQEKENVGSFASRGEQRMAILWLKIAELKYIFNLTQEKPLLLLDDIFSELDEDHKKVVFEVIVSHQTIITSAEKTSGLIENLKGLEIINL